MMFANDARPEWLCINSYRNVDKIARNGSNSPEGRPKPVIYAMSDADTLLFSSFKSAAAHSGVTFMKLSRAFSSVGFFTGSNGFEYRPMDKKGKKL